MVEHTVNQVRTNEKQRDMKKIEVKNCIECPYLESKGQIRSSEERYFLHKCRISKHEIKDDFFNDSDNVFDIPNNCPL